LLPDARLVLEKQAKALVCFMVESIFAAESAIG
jgi:hypothetical protein